MSLRPLFTALLCAMLATGAHALEIMVPAYFYPSSVAAQNPWITMQAALAQGVKITAIMNPANGPGTALNSDYRRAVDDFRAAGGRVLGYVFTCYGGSTCVDGNPASRSAADVLGDVQRYADWYGVDGVFLDEMSRLTQDLPYYTSVSTALRQAHPGWQIVGNVGTSAPAEYLAVADTLITFEGAGSSYAGSASEPWMSTAPASRQAQLFYNFAGATDMASLLRQAAARHAGYVYLTDDRYTPGNPSEPNPWDSLPSYWAAEVAAVSAVPEPAPALLALAGLAAWAVRRRLTGNPKRGPKRSPSR
jgi:hypothetical protein